MSNQTPELRSEDFDQRAAQAILNLYELAAGGGGHSGEAVTAPYRELLDAAEARFRRAAGNEDLQGMADGWNELTEILAHVAHANARVGTVLLGTVVKSTNLDAQGALNGALKVIREN